MHSKIKPKATKPKDDDKTQRERFIEAARAIGVDETGKEFDEAFSKIIRPKRADSTKP